MDIEGIYLSIIKAIYDKPQITSSSILKNKVFPLRSEMKQGCPFSLLIFNTVL